jgi:uncharacterized LabA/DUF88 family protein
MSKAHAYIDGWNFYHGINTPELHPLGFVDLRRLCERMLRGRADLRRVHYFTAVDYNKPLHERQEFWFDALESAGVTIGEKGFFRLEDGKYKEKMTDVRMALKIAEDVASGEDFDSVLLVSADADFVPALEQAERFNKKIYVAFPPGLSCKELAERDPKVQRIDRDDLELCLFDGDGTTARGTPLRKAGDYGWAYRSKGRVNYGSRDAEVEHWERWEGKRPHMLVDAKIRSARSRSPNRNSYPGVPRREP